MCDRVRPAQLIGSVRRAAELTAAFKQLGLDPHPASNLLMTVLHSHHAGLLARNTVFNLLGQILPLLVGFFSIPYVVRGLGADRFGILSIAWMLLGTFSMFDLGLGRATTKFVAECLNPEKIHRLPGLVWTSILIQTAMGAAGGLLIAAFVPLLVHHLFKMPASLVAEASLSLFILSAGMPVLLLANAARGVLEAAQRFDLVNYIKVPTSFSFYVIAVLGIPLHLRVSTIILLSVLTRLLSAGAFLILCARVFPQLRRSSRISPEELPALFSFGGWVMVSNTVGPILGYFERFLIASVLSVSVLTYYAVPSELVSRVVIFPSSIAATLFPFISRQAGRNDIVSDVTSRSIKYLLFIMTPLTATFVCFAHEIVRLWMGDEFAAQSARVLSILAVALFLNAFAYIPFTSVQALGKPHLKAILDVISLPLYVGYCWLLMHYMRLNGAAIGKALASGIDCAVLFFFAWRLRAFSVRALFSGTLLRAWLLSTTLFAVVIGIRLASLPLGVALALLTLSVAMYLAVCWRIAITSNDRNSIRSLPRQLFPGSACSLSTSQ